MEFRSCRKSRSKQFTITILNYKNKIKNKKNLTWLPLMAGFNGIRVGGVVGADYNSRGWGDKILNRYGTCLSRVKVKEPWSIYSLLDQVKQI